MTNAQIAVDFPCELPSPQPYREIKRPPFEQVPLPPITSRQRAHLIETQAHFDARFPPLRHADDDVLILSWAEIHRQFLDLSAAWDQQEPDFLIRRARQHSIYESPEKTLRWLFVLSHYRTSVDTPRPRLGTGARLPMP